MKYELTSNTKILQGRTLYQIKALKDFSDVKKGDLGGYVESESNLSQNSDCWIYNEASVFGNARVYGNARVQDNTRVYDYSCVFENARVVEYSCVCGNARVFENDIVKSILIDRPIDQPQEHNTLYKITATKNTNLGQAVLTLVVPKDKLSIGIIDLQSESYTIQSVGLM